MKRPLAVPAVLFIVGILFSEIISPARAEKFIVIIGILLFIAILFSLVFIKKNKYFHFSVYTFFFLLGVFSALRMFPEKNDIGKFVSASKEKAVIFGTVSGISEVKKGPYGWYSVFPLRVKKLSIGEEEHNVSGFTQVTTARPARKVYAGEDIVIGGWISEASIAKNQGTFDYKKYLETRRIRAIMSNSRNDVFLKMKFKKNIFFAFRKLLADMRASAGEVFEKRLSRPAGAIVKSVILGARGDLNRDIQNVFMKTGTMHILAVSGLHAGIIAVIFAAILRLARCPKKITYFLTICALCVFAAFTGARPSTLRAVIMASCILINLAIGKNSDIVNGLVLSAFVITFFQPRELYNLGFVLSYLSILSIIYIVPLVMEFFKKIPRSADESKISFARRYFFTSLATSFSVWIGLMPIIALNFGIITPSVVISNLIAVPVLFVVIILGIGLLVTEFLVILAPIGIFFAWITNGIIHFFMEGMRVISEMPFAFVKVGPPRFFLIGVFYLSLMSALIVFIRKKRKVLFLIFLIFTANLFIWQEVLNASAPGAFKCTFFSVEKADAALLEFSDGSSMMIDGGHGEDITGWDAGSNILEPYLRQKGKRKIDCVLVSHAHEDHVGGLSHIIKNFKTGCVVMSEPLSKDVIKHEFYRRFLRIIKEKGIRCLQVENGDEIKGFSGVEIKVLNPSVQGDHTDLNDRSIALNVKTKKEKSILFCADISTKITNEILANYPDLKADIIKFPHHGGGFGNIADMERFLNSVKPKAVIISNKTRGVNKNLIKLLKEKQIECYITGDAGAVTVEEDGAGFKISTFCDSE